MATLFSERFFLFIGRRVQNKNKQPFRQILTKPFLVSTFNPQEVLKKWTGWHITEERQPKTQKNNQILSLHKSLPSFLQNNISRFFLWCTLFWEPQKPTAYWGSSKTDSNTVTYRQNAKGFPPNGLMNYFQSNWSSTIKIGRYYILRNIC